MSYPEALLVGEREYEINTSYEDALACIACINDTTLSEAERAYGVLEILYKEDPEDKIEATRMAVKYLQLGKESPAEDAPPPDMDYEYDMHYIRSSFRSDYGIDLNQTAGMHWWEFMELLQGLTDKCILNRIRDLRTYDITSVKDLKTRAKIIRAQREVALPKKLDQEEQDTLDAFFAQLGTPAEE